MTTTGKLELTIKINAIPQPARLVKDLWVFELECDRHLVSVAVKPKTWKKLQQAQTDFPQWVAAITGQMGAATEQGFVLEQPNVQVFEKKPKAAVEQPAVELSPTPHSPHHTPSKGWRKVMDDKTLSKGAAR